MCSWKAISTYLNEDSYSRHWVGGGYSVECRIAKAKLSRRLQSKRGTDNKQVNTELWNLHVSDYSESWEDLLGGMGNFFWFIFYAEP